MNDSSTINDRTDYYELFGVEETASQEQLKKAYRKAAMKWHPDRNHNNVEEATRVFQIIEHAYSILSDPHERAWYDGHRHVVVNEFGEFDATNVDIEGLFSAGAYSGFNDGPNGFYTVFQKAFRDLGDEEKSASKIPLFGDSTSSYEKVAEFYNFWTCFTTKRSFAFKDIYRLKDAPNARYKRAMNQENEKARQKAQRDFVQLVRELALFAKKRDPRVKKHLEEVEKQNEERRKLAEQKKLERQKEVEKELESILNDNSNPISYKENDILYLKEFDNEETEPQWHCDYCGRDMNTESAFKQHCNTKKHKKLSATARKDFLADPTLFEHTKYTFTLLGLTDYEIEEVTGKPAEMFFSTIQDQNKAQNQDENNEEEEEEINPRRGKQNKKQNQKQKKKNNKNKRANNDDDDEYDDKDDKGDNIDDDDDNDDDEIQSKNSKKQKQNNNNNNNNQGKKGKGKNQQNQQQNQTSKNNQQKIPKKEKHKQKMQRLKEAREKAELEELEKQKQKEREEKEKIESIISKSQSGDKFNENSNNKDDNNNNDNENDNEKEDLANHGPKLSKKEKKRLRQLEEARKRFLIQDDEEEELKEEENEDKDKNNEDKENDENKKIEEEEEEKNETDQPQNSEQTQKVTKRAEKVIEIIDENGKKVKVTMTDNFDDEPEVNEEDHDNDINNDNDNGNEQEKEKIQNQSQNQRNQGQQKGKNKNKNKGPKRAPPGMFMCRKCHAVFPSKTKLFKHLEETNHATAYG